MPRAAASAPAATSSCSRAAATSDAEEAKRFFFAEYRLNHLLFTYPKPTIAIMDGITMGGGVGISLPCDYRIATENTRLAMPETGIGLFPDVGGGWYLSRLPGRIGQFMALTGARLDGAECHYLGLATHYVEQSGLAELVERILRAAANGCRAHSEPRRRRRPKRGSRQNLPQIAQLFASDRLEDVVAALDADGSDWAQTRAGDARDQEPAVVQGLAAPACRRRARAPASPTRCAPNMRSPAASSAPTTSAKACARC